MSVAVEFGAMMMVATRCGWAHHGAFVTAAGSTVVVSVVVATNLKRHRADTDVGSCRLQACDPRGREQTALHVNGWCTCRVEPHVITVATKRGHTV